MAKTKTVKSDNAKQPEKRDEPAGENVTRPSTQSDDVKPAESTADAEVSDVADALGFNAAAAQLEGDRIIANQQPDKMTDEPSAASPEVAVLQEQPAPEPTGPTLRGPCPTPGCKGRLGSSTVQRVKGSRARVRYLVCHTCGQPGGKETC